MLFLNKHTGHGYFIRTTQSNQIQKVWVDPINERQQETHGLLGIKANSMNKPITGAMSASRKLQLLESDLIT